MIFSTQVPGKPGLLQRRLRVDSWSGMGSKSGSGWGCWVWGVLMVQFPHWLRCFRCWFSDRKDDFWKKAWSFICKGKWGTGYVPLDGGFETKFVQIVLTIGFPLHHSVSLHQPNKNTNKSLENSFKGTFLWMSKETQRKNKKQNQPEKPKENPKEHRKTERNPKKIH